MLQKQSSELFIGPADGDKTQIITQWSRLLLQLAVMRWERVQDCDGAWRTPSSRDTAGM